MSTFTHVLSQSTRSSLRIHILMKQFGALWQERGVDQTTKNAMLYLWATSGTNTRRKKSTKKQPHISSGARQDNHWSELKDRRIRGTSKPWRVQMPSLNPGWRPPSFSFTLNVPLRTMVTLIFIVLQLCFKYKLFHCSPLCMAELLLVTCSCTLTPI